MHVYLWRHTVASEKTQSKGRCNHYRLFFFNSSVEIKDDQNFSVYKKKKKSTEEQKSKEED